MAAAVYRKVHIGYLAAIVAAANGGGSGSVVGDTTTTMMWISGVDPLDVLEAFIASGVALAIFGVIAARQQQAYSPIVKDAPAGLRIDWARAAIVLAILAAAVVAPMPAALLLPPLPLAVSRSPPGRPSSPARLLLLAPPPPVVRARS